MKGLFQTFSDRNISFSIFFIKRVIRGNFGEKKKNSVNFSDSTYFLLLASSPPLTVSSVSASWRRRRIFSSSLHLCISASLRFILSTALQFTNLIPFQLFCHRTRISKVVIKKSPELGSVVSVHCMRKFVKNNIIL